MSSLQYHVAVILLHRPFIAVHRNTSDPSSFYPSESSTHLKECSQSAQAISNIFKLYNKHYSLRRIPISAIHCAFTASIIVLLETTSSDGKERSRATASMAILVGALAEMSIAWAWSQRALDALRQLGREWSVSEDAMKALGIGEEKDKDTVQGPVTGDAQTHETWDPNFSLWMPQDLQGFDVGIPFAGTDGLDYQDWIGTLFTEPGFPGDAA
ncbi:unnamed protein product [Clonostachys rosea]|uniref:SMODS and SLOG-associating 2TM effector domain-containing protein n=1 Tax=Bionectria ochroleuca TaxID=29856 RepID=A0ABY6U6B9_BIOOC|nr:unnamed protein product [Clonostachys rosea]